MRIVESDRQMTIEQVSTPALQRAHHYASAEYYSLRVPALTGDNKRAAVLATSAHLRCMLAIR